MKNKLILACAGSGKTTFIINEALKIKNSDVLITTFTINNKDEIKRKIIEINNGVFPKNIHVKTWFSFLIDEGVKPYKYRNSPENIEGINFQYSTQRTLVKENDVKRYYFDSENKIFSDKISEFVVKSNMNANNRIAIRLKNIYKHIYIDEIQDMAGFDLDLIKLFNDYFFEIMLVGDLRQITYKTNHQNKNKKYGSDLKGFFQDIFIIDREILNKSYRNNQIICDFASKIHNSFLKEEIISANFEKNEHLGVFLVKKEDCEFYLNKYEPIQLRHSKITKINDKYKVWNFGESKGSTFDRVIIYPTDKIKKWIQGELESLNDKTQCSFYVAVTRARYSVAILWDNNKNNIYDLPMFSRSERDKNEK